MMKAGEHGTNIFLIFTMNFYLQILFHLDGHSFLFDPHSRFKGCGRLRSEKVTLCNILILILSTVDS